MNRYEFQQAVDSLDLGFSAGQVILTLTRHKHGVELSENDNGVLTQMVEFLEKAVKGEEELGGAASSREAMESSGIYRKAFRALSIVEAREDKNQESKTNLKAMYRIATHIRDKTDVSTNDLEVLRSFFAVLAEDSLEETRELLQSEKPKQRLERWFYPSTA